VKAASAALLSMVLLAGAATAYAQDDDRAPLQARAAPPAAGDGINAGEVAQFLLGGAIGLVTHEAGHVVAGAAFGADPGIKGIRYGFIPFFAITHNPVSPAREYTISSAGFWVQSLTSEWLLTRRPNLRGEHAPIAKGVLAFDVLASAVYGVAGMGHFGPPERDTRSMAVALRVNEAWVGTAVIAPAIFDTWRYVRPDAKFPRWASRVSKVTLVLLVIRAANPAGPARTSSSLR
jgi:hypothetical protein